MNSSFTISKLYRDYGVGLFADASLLFNMSNCQACPVKEDPIIDLRDPPVKYLVIGDYPGLEEHQGRRLFIGPAGRFLRELLTKEGIDDDNVAFLNAFLCYGAHNRINHNNPIYYCQPRILYYIAYYNPEVIICMGRHACGVLEIPNQDLYDKPAAYRLETPWFEAYLVATINPALYLRNKWSDVLYKNILMAARLAKCLGDYDCPTIESVSIGFPDNVQETRPRGITCNMNEGY